MPSPDTLVLALQRVRDVPWSLHTPLFGTWTSTLVAPAGVIDKFVPVAELENTATCRVTCVLALPYSPPAGRRASMVWLPIDRLDSAGEGDALAVGVRAPPVRAVDQPLDGERVRRSRRYCRWKVTAWPEADGLAELVIASVAGNGRTYNGMSRVTELPSVVLVVLGASRCRTWEPPVPAWGVPWTAYWVLLDFDQGTGRLADRWRPRWRPGCPRGG